MDEETRVGGIPHPNSTPPPEGWSDSSYQENTQTVDGAGLYPSAPQSAPNGYPSSGYPSQGNGSSVYSSGGGYPSQGYGSAPQQFASGGYATDQAVTAVAPKPNRTSAWLAGATILTALVVAACLVYFFTQKKQPEAAPGPTTVAAQPSNNSQQPSNGDTTSALGDQTTSSSSSTSQVYDDFPADAGTSCTGGGYIDTGKIQRLGDNSSQSCAFLNGLASKVTDYVEGHPSAKTYTVDVYSEAVKKNYTFSCERVNHLSTCTSVGKNNKPVGGYIKDTTQ